jgi:hypothetical protein
MAATTTTTMQMTGLLSAFNEITGNTIQTLANKYGFDPVEAQKVVNHAYAAALTAETPIDATQAVAQTTGLPTGKPKRVPAAFDLWSKQARASIRDQLNSALLEGADKAKSAEVTKALREAWKALPDDAKAPFNAESKALRLAAKPPADPNAKKTKKAKDPNAPNKPKNAFMRFSDDNRATVKAELQATLDAQTAEDAELTAAIAAGTAKAPTVQMAAVAQVLGAQWKELGADERQPYDLAAQADKERYALEKAAYDEQKAAAAAAPAPEAAAAPAEDDGADDVQGAMTYDE